MGGIDFVFRFVIYWLLKLMLLFYQLAFDYLVLDQELLF